MKTDFRSESDLLGQKNVPSTAYYGAHTQRAVENFPLSGQPVAKSLIHAFGFVKKACAQTNQSLGTWKETPEHAQAIEKACTEMAQGLLDEHIVVDCMQGGAGTSTNMNVNEVIANRALEIIGAERGDYQKISPLDDINLHQSTNDTYPTAVKLAAITLLHDLEDSLAQLQKAFQEKEAAFADVLKIGRTQLQDAVPVTLGREMSAYAEAIGRDRWRVYKCEERLRVVNLGGTAIGTGITAPRDYIFRVVDTLREITNIGFARADNLIDCTQNADVFVEVSGILKASASTLMKIATDLRLLSSGPDGGFGEITLPAKQAGSSIMPGKINPVIPEAVTQAAMRVMAHDMEITFAASCGNLELNAFEPLIADALLRSIELLTNATTILRVHCIEGLVANRARCAANVETSTALVTSLVPLLGHEKAVEVARTAKEQGITIRNYILNNNLMDEAMFNQITSPEAMMQLGYKI